jgi:hypothetical protein
MKNLFRLLPLALLLVSLALLSSGCCRFCDHRDQGRHHCNMDCQKSPCDCCKHGQKPCADCAMKKPCMHKDGCPMKGEMKAAAADAQQNARPDVVFICACGPDCKCNSISKTQGSCACGKPMQEAHVLKVEGDEALLCICGDDCKCQLDPNNPERCGCGKPVKRVSLKGTGLYFCNCGGSCSCNTLSDKPAQCRCGMPLKQAN